jgi:beta-1,4-N-acetylglucosaminyltransferase
MTKAKRRIVFVTVGTTLFDSLVESITSPSALEHMASNGFTDLIIQHGKGKAPCIAENFSLRIDCFDFKPSLRENMLEADLIVSHAGAGTVMEALAMDEHRQGKLAVVINSRLMDNHQVELAQAMGNRNHLYVIEEPELLQKKETWDNLVSFTPVRKDPGDASDFPRVLDTYFGFTKQD